MSRHQDAPATPGRAVRTAVLRVGFWSAVLTTIWIVAFDLALLAGVSGIPTGSLPVIASLLIAPPLVSLMASLHGYVPHERRIWTQTGLSFSIAYAALVAFNYFLQLTVVRQNPAAYPWLTMDFKPDSAFWALEVLGYSFMSLAALCVVPALGRGRHETPIRWLFVANAALNGLGDVAYVLTANPLNLLVLASLGVWAVAFPGATALLAVMFKGAEQV